MKIDMEHQDGVHWVIIAGRAVRWSAINAVWWNGEEYIVEAAGCNKMRLTKKEAQKIFKNTCIKV